MSSSLDKIKYWRKRNLDLDSLIKGRYHRDESNYPCKQALPKFDRALSESKLSHSHQENHKNKLPTTTSSKMRLYRQLNHQLSEIKETLKESLVKSVQGVQGGNKKKGSKHRQNVITQISEPETRQKYARNYYDVLDHIAEIKSKEREQEIGESRVQNRMKSREQGRLKKREKRRVKDMDPEKGKSRGQEGGKGRQQERDRGNETSAVRVGSQLGQEKTLFYGMDWIDSIEFKIKIKVSRTQYHLFAKNNHLKVMLEMSYPDYMRLHLGELGGNPCNILQRLSLKGNHPELRLHGKKAPASLKSYMGSY